MQHNGNFNYHKGKDLTEMERLTEIQRHQDGRIYKRLLFIGAGQMGGALITGLIEKGIFSKENIRAVEPMEARRQEIEEITNISLYPAATKELLLWADMILLAVKPQVMAQVLQSISQYIDKQLIISIAAGISTRYIEGYLHNNARVIRVMPNTPALIHEGAAAISKGSNVSEMDLLTVKRLFEAVGTAVVLPEVLMDCVTGLSGSGPAYCFLFIEALIEGGVLEGLSRDVAQELAVQTVIGAAKMVNAQKEHPSRLISMVTSPGGTTIRGLYALERHSFKAAVMKAVSEATMRSKELGKDM